jgi:hypothetical protein
MGIGDLPQFHWDHQTGKMRDHGRKVFHWEHMVPVGQLREELLAPAVVTTSDVKRVIRKARVAWILKSEDKKLTEKGVRNLRSENPELDYQSVGIELGLPRAPA